MTLLTIDTTAVIISAIGGFVSLASLVITILLKGKVTDYHKEVDGKMTELIDTTKKLGNAEGRAEQTEEQKT